MKLAVDEVRECFEGAVPGTVATAHADGTPNISYLSHVQYVDAFHVALSYQFFNKTHENMLANPRALLTVIHPRTAAQYRLSLRFVRTETAGPLFERMKAKLAGIASHVGMAHVFRLLGADVFEVVALEQVPGKSLPAQPRPNLLAALRAATERIRPGFELQQLLGETLDSLAEHFGIGQSMVLLHDEAGRRLYTVTSRGYEESGVGSEIALGEGVIGVAARECTPIRIGHMSGEYAYNRAIRANASLGQAPALETAIPFPGCANPGSQMAVPIMIGERMCGVLYVESPQDLRFSYDDEDALVALCCTLGTSMQVLRLSANTGGGEEPAAFDRAPPLAGEPAVVRYYPEDSSVFLDDSYLIKGMAGAIFAVLMRDFTGPSSKNSFTTRELRLDPRIGLHDASDNLEARLLLLIRRLAERGACIQIERTGRGQYRLCPTRPLVLAEVDNSQENRGQV
jgi:adenylate cyclase